MLLDFWSELTHWLFSIAIAAHKQTVKVASEQVTFYRNAVRANRERIGKLEDDNIILQNAADELQDWVDSNNDENIVL